MRIAFSLIALWGIFPLFAQERKVSDILAQREVLRPTYVLKTTVLQAMVINMSYGNDEVISETDRKLLAGAQVASIDLVFSDFPKGQDLKGLNKTRIEKIYALRKDLVTNPDISWKVIRQTACSNESEAKVLFHGIVIHYLPKQGKETMMMDMDVLSNLPSTPDSLKRLVTRDRPYGVAIKDSTIIKVLERNKEWKNMLIVADMTGSMSPYTTELIVWFQLKMKDNRVKQVVFFNDGDMKNDRDKVVGNIGGIYMAKTATYEGILETARSTISHGSGGDGPENNCEALIKGISEYPEADEIILIADNFAPVKDIALLKEIKRPVRIILCGTDFAPIHPDYFALAHQTGGSIHTMKEDIASLALLNEGETIKVGGKVYQLVKGTFVEVVKT